MVKNIPVERLFIYVILVSLLPIAVAFYSFINTKKELSRIEQLLKSAEEQITIQQYRQAGNLATIAHYRDADHFYIDKELESIVLLEDEINALDQILKSKNSPGDEFIQKRYNHLTKGDNSISFTEGVVLSHKLFQETTETLARPVEVNAKDLKKLLSLIEGTLLDSSTDFSRRPQLLILDFKIEKKEPTPNNQIYLLNLKLLKREFL